MNTTADLRANNGCTDSDSNSGDFASGSPNPRNTASLQNPCSAGGPTKNRKGFTSSSVSTGAADLVRDNGYDASIDYKPAGYIDLEFDYSRSVPLQLNSYSFGIGVDLSWVLRPHIH